MAASMLFDLLVNNGYHMKIQLLVVVEKDNEVVPWNSWSSFFEESFAPFDSIHILYEGSECNNFKQFHQLINRSNFFLHAYFGDLLSQINYLVRKDCDYYVILFTPSVEVFNVPNRIKELSGQVALVDADYLTVVFTDLHRRLDGFGLQTIMEKIQILCENKDARHLIYNSAEEFFNGSNTANKTP
jgi:hypothetical protein